MPSQHSTVDTSLLPTVVAAAATVGGGAPPSPGGRGASSIVGSVASITSISSSSLSSSSSLASSPSSPSWRRPAYLRSPSWRDRSIRSSVTAETAMIASALDKLERQDSGIKLPMTPELGR